jgi:hypothetical protein
MLRIVVKGQWGPNYKQQVVKILVSTMQFDEVECLILISLCLSSARLNRFVLRFLDKLYDPNYNIGG